MILFSKAYNVICIVWILFEIAFAIFRRSAGSTEDKGTLALLWITIVVSTAIGNTIPYSLIGYWGIPIYIRWLGLALIPAGIIIRIIAIRTLGKYFTTNVATSTDQKVIDIGIYKHIRHPAYSGSLISFLGMGLALSNWLSLLIIFVPVALAFIYRIRIEEKALINTLGQPYIEYMGRTARLIPYII